MSKEKINSKDPMYNRAFMALKDAENGLISKGELKTKVEEFLDADLSDDVIDLHDRIVSYLEKGI